MIDLDDPIAILAYCELVLECQYSDCLEILSDSLNTPPLDPVEVWALEIAGIARKKGWVSRGETVFCPLHSGQNDSNLSSL